MIKKEEVVASTHNFYDLEKLLRVYNETRKSLDQNNLQHIQIFFSSEFWRVGEVYSKPKSRFYHRLGEWLGIR